MGLLQILLNSSENRLSESNLSSYNGSTNPEITLMSCCWSPFAASKSRLWYGIQNCTRRSRSIYLEDDIFASVLIFSYSLLSPYTFYHLHLKQFLRLANSSLPGRGTTWRLELRPLWLRRTFGDVHVLTCLPWSEAIPGNLPPIRGSHPKVSWQEEAAATSTWPVRGGNSLFSCRFAALYLHLYRIKHKNAIE